MVVAAATGTSQKQQPHSISPDVGTAGQQLALGQAEIRSSQMLDTYWLSVVTESGWLETG